MSKTILVVDDEERLVSLLKAYLSQEGFRVITARNGREALYLARAEKPDLILLDIMMPEMDGHEFMRMHRKERETPIILLTAKIEEDDKVIGLELGADDYVTKPFSPRELVARVKAQLRRSSGFRQQTTVIRQGVLSIDPASHQVFCGEKRIELTATEYRLLQFLASNPGFVYSRSALIDGALGRDVTVLERTIDVHIMSLRRKLGKCGGRIETIRGFGYKFQESPAKE
jgi:DNA-binding response OmpR family regulator